MKKIYSFEDYIDFVGISKLVGELSLEDLYSIYEKFNLFVIIDLINRKMIFEKEK